MAGVAKAESTTINFRVDSELKREAEALFADLGLNLSSALTVFLRCSVNNGGIPFKLERPRYNQETLEALSEYPAMKANPEAYPRYKSFAQYLKAQGLD